MFLELYITGCVIMLGFSIVIIINIMRRKSKLKELTFTSIVLGILTALAMTSLSWLCVGFILASIREDTSRINDI